MKIKKIIINVPERDLEYLSEYDIGDIKIAILDMIEFNKKLALLKKQKGGQKKQCQR